LEHTSGRSKLKRTDKVQAVGRNIMRNCSYEKNQRYADLYLLRKSKI